MSNARSTKAVECNGGGYDGNKTSRITLRLWWNIGNCIWVVLNIGTKIMGEWKNGGMVGVGLMDGNMGGGSGGIRAAM